MLNKSLPAEEEVKNELLRGNSILSTISREQLEKKVKEMVRCNQQNVDYDAETFTPDSLEEGKIFELKVENGVTTLHSPTENSRQPTNANERYADDDDISRWTNFNEEDRSFAVTDQETIVTNDTGNNTESDIIETVIQQLDAVTSQNDVAVTNNMNVNDSFVRNTVQTSPPEMGLEATEQEENLAGIQSGAFESSRGRRTRVSQVGSTLDRDPAEILHDIQTEIQENTGNIMTYPRFGTRGYFGEVHYGRHFLEVVYHGYDATVDNFDDNNPLTNDNVNTLVAKEHRSKKGKPIHGGQQYSPSMVLHNYTKNSDLLKDNLKQLPQLVKDTLECGEVGNSEQSLNASKSRLTNIMNTVDKLSKQILVLDRARDNCPVRTEFTFSHQETSNDDFPLIKFAWPTAVDICNCVSVVQHQELYFWQKNFVKFVIDPLKILSTMDSNKILGIDSSIRTLLVWCAESLVTETANSSFEGAIHHILKNKIDVAGNFFIHTKLRIPCSLADKQLFPMFEWGIDPKVLDTRFRLWPKKTIGRIQKEEAYEKAILRYKGQIDYPNVYVEAVMAFRVLNQRMGLCKCKKHDIGLFEPINWRNIALMNGTKCDVYVQQMCRILLQAYHDNRYYILKCYCCDWVEKREFSSNPKTRMEVDCEYSDSLYFTTIADDQQKATTLCGQSLTQNEKQMISSVGTSYLYL